MISEGLLVPEFTEVLSLNTRFTTMSIDKTFTDDGFTFTKTLPFTSCSYGSYKVTAVPNTNFFLVAVANFGRNFECPPQPLSPPENIIDSSVACSAVETIDSNPLDVKSVVECPDFKASKEMLAQLGKEGVIWTCPSFFDVTSSPPSPAPTAKSSKSSVPLIAGIIGGAVAVIAALGATFYFGRRVGSHSVIRAVIKRKFSGVHHLIVSPRRQTVLPVLEIPSHLLSLTIDPLLVIAFSSLVFDVVPGTAEKVVLGRGAFGVVLAAEVRDTRCAVKLIKAELITADTVMRFKRELDLVVTLRHPSIVQCLGCCWEPPDNFALICELCEKGSLDKLVKSDPTFTWQGTSSQSYKSAWALQISQAVSPTLSRTPPSPLFQYMYYAQNANQLAPCFASLALQVAFLHSLTPPIVHRDLKCGNVLIDYGMHAKLTDFGESRALAAKDETMTEVGTPYFMVSAWLMTH